jgi:PIN domain nuclease of toxin-antitoxin system
MTLLVDTHSFLWFNQDDPALSARAKALLEDPANEKLVSLACCWEIAIKAGIGKLALGEPTATYIPNALARAKFGTLPITLDHVVAVERLPPHHRDPFDRMIVAQALAENVAVVSADAVLDAYGVTRLW